MNVHAQWSSRRASGCNVWRLVCCAIALSGGLASSDGALMAATPKGDGSRIRNAEAVLFWNEEALKTIRLARTPPPLAALHLAAYHAAIFDSVNGLAPRYAPAVATDSAPQGLSMEVTVAASAHEVLQALWGQAANPANFRLAFERAVRDAAVDEATARSSEEWGRRVARAVLASRANAGAAQPKPFTPVVEPGLWRPTPPQFRPAVMPQIAEVRPFVLPRAADFRSPPPPAFDSAEAVADLRVVRRLGARDDAERTPEQTASAPFFSDDLGTSTPPGRWNAIAQQAVRLRGLDALSAARLFALMNFAIADGGIVCWETKYTYRTWRPESAIREGVRAADGSWALEPDPHWIPLMGSPAHPDYISGHGTFSGAGARMLALVLGSDELTIALDSDGLPGVVRTFASFSACAEAIADSRLFGGIHTPTANRVALETGRKIADYVFAHALLPREGTR